MTLKKCALLGWAFLFSALPAWTEAAVSADTSLGFTVSSLPEAQMTFTQGFNFPVLRGSGPLTAGNNLRTTLSAALTPVSVSGAAEAVLTPAAFAQLAAGISLGSGWNIRLLGKDLTGMGLNLPRSDGGGEVRGEPLDGLVWRAHLGGTFQFDAAAIFPGDWNHIVFQTYHEVYYRAYTRASGDGAWFYEADDGENQNGFNYYGNFLLGYQMPIFLNTVGLLAEMDKYLYGSPKGDLWGDDLIRWLFGGLFNFTITDRLSTAVIAQFRTLRNYTNPDAKDLYYRNRSLDTSNPIRLEFYRAALILSYKLR
jgi:hypothetical protein